MVSLFGIIGVIDKCLEALSRFCSNTLTTLDVNGCIGIKRRSREELLQLFPHLRCFKVHDAVLEKCCRYAVNSLGTENTQDVQ
ncbi:unnamed protein product [Camellia sinensis]